MCTSLVDGALAKVLTWEAMGPKLLDGRGKLVAKWCWKIVLKVVGETRWPLTEEVCEGRQGRVPKNHWLSKSKC